MDVTPEEHFAGVVGASMGVTEGFRVLDLTASPCLTDTVYDTKEAALACPIEKRIVLDAGMPWRTWYVSYDGPRLIGEYPDIESAMASMSCAHIQLRITGPSEDLRFEDGRCRLPSG